MSTAETIYVAVTAAVWLLVLVFVLGLCRAAARGNAAADDDEQARYVAEHRRRK